MYHNDEVNGITVWVGKMSVSYVFLIKILY